MPAANLALWQVPPVTPKGEDAVLDLNQNITNLALNAAPNVSVVQLCALGQDNCNTKPFTKKEMLYVVQADGSNAGERTPEMNPSRALHITPAHAALNGFFDAVLSSNRFRGPKGDNLLTREETIAEIRQREPKSANDANFEKCLRNIGTAAACSKTGARAGLGIVVDEGLNYGPTGTFYGTFQRNAQTASK